jgi:hypothetical protein
MYVHLAGFYIASHPRPVREAIERYRKAIDENSFLTINQLSPISCLGAFGVQLRYADTNAQGQVLSVTFCGSDNLGSGFALYARKSVHTSAFTIRASGQSSRV